MKNEHFNLIGQKSVNGKMILIAVVPDDIFGDNLPSIFEVQAVRTVPNVFTGTYPTIRIIDDTLKPRPDLRGEGVAGIVTGENWFNESIEHKDIFGINFQQ